MASLFDASDVRQETVTLFFGMDYFSANGRGIEVSGSAWPSLAGSTINLVDRNDVSGSVAYSSVSASVSGASGTVQTVRVELAGADLGTWGRGRHIRHLKATFSGPKDIMLARLIVDVL